MLGLLVLLVTACSHGGKPSPTNEGSTVAAPVDNGSASAAQSAADTTVPARPASVTDDMVAGTDHALAVLLKLATDLALAGSCKDATAAVQANRAALQEIAADTKTEKAWASAGMDAKQWFAAIYAARFASTNEKVMNKALACKQDPDFKAAFDQANSSHG
jgi:hypothetical protein